MAQHLTERLLYYKKKLERSDDKEEKLNIIRKLDTVPITLQLLKETGIGKLIKQLGKEDGRIGAKAAIVLKKWKEIAIAENAAVETAAKSANKHTKSSADHSANDQLLHSKPKYTNGHSVSRTSSSEQPSKKIKYTSESSSYKKHSSHLSNGSVPEDDTSTIKYCSFDDALYGAGSTEPYNPERPEIYYEPVPQVEYKPTPISAINGIKVKTEKSEDKHHQVKTHSTKPHQTETHSYKHHQAETQPDKHHKHGEKRKRIESQNHDSHTESHNHIKTESHNHIKTESHYHVSKTESQSHASKTKSSGSSKSEATKHSSEQKSKHSSSSTQKLQKLTSSPKASNKDHSSSEKKKSSKSHKSSQKTPTSKKMKVSNAEEFTASAGMNFEDILGFNDIVTPKKKKTNPNKPAKLCVVPPLQVSSPEEKPKSLKVEEEHVSKKKSHSSKDDHISKKSHSSKEATSASSSSKSSKHSKSSKKDVMPDDLKEMPKLDELKPIDITSTLPEIQPNYKPLPQIDYDKLCQKKKNLSNEEAIMYTSSKKDRTAVYSGRRNFYMTEVPSLFEMCTRILIENIDCLEYFGGVPYFIMKPVLERCTPQQLYRLEDYNPDLAQETNELWKSHCLRDFRSRKPEEGETWRELYLRVFDENEKNLKRLTAKISANNNMKNPVRQVKLAYVDSVVKPPRDVARRQAKHGTAQPVNHTLKGGSSPSKAVPGPAAAAAPQAATPVPPPPKATTYATTLKKPKKAPLFAKSLKALKNLHRR